MSSTTRKRKLKIYQEEVKLRHTSHWDADYMSREEFEAYMEGKTMCQVKRGADAPSGDSGAAGPLRSLWDRFLRACLPRR